MRKRTLFFMAFPALLGIVCIGFWKLKKNDVPLTIHEIASISIEINNYDNRGSTYSYTTDDEDEMSYILDFDGIVKSKDGHDVFGNAARWYVTITYKEKNEKIITHMYSGDKHFDVISDAVEELKLWHSNT